MAGTSAANSNASASVSKPRKMSKPAVAAMRKVIVRRPRVRKAGNQKMPRKMGITPTYKPINVKPQNVAASGCGVSNATGISTTNPIALVVKTLIPYASP
ncbi:MAG: hypothetical protein U0X93_04005 [Anaerolineales bacterium]